MSANNESGILRLEIRIGGEVAITTIAVDDDGDWSVQLEQRGSESQRLEGDAHEFSVPTAQYDAGSGGSSAVTIRAIYISN